jgi:hypothetical protein
VVARRLSSCDVLEALWELFLGRGLPEHIRSDNVLNRESRTIFGREFPLN